MNGQPAQMGKGVPTVHSLSDVYVDINNSMKDFHEPRFKNIRKRFQELYGCAPAFYCRAPGRVNTMGDHIDCNGYSVMPMALEQDFIMAYVPVHDGEGSEEIVINNADDSQFSEIRISNDPHQKLSEEPLSQNYFLCGVKAVLALDESIASQVSKVCGMKIFLDSNVPIAAGLSSSSAYTVCSAIVTAHANGILDKISSQQLADLTITAERMAGTACGGMDQTISIMGVRGTVSKVDFNPITSTPAKIPESCALVIANSCRKVPKLLTLGTQFNKRVSECRFALAAMTLKAGLADSFDSCPFKTFQELQRKLGYSFDQMLELAEQSFSSKDQYTSEMICTEFKTEDPFKLVMDVSHWEEVQSQNTHFELYKRAFHVYSEVKRVHKFADLCHDASVEEDQKAVELGKLITASQLSQAKYYDNSSKHLNELTQLALESGALGSKLSGAGWGGCTVSLVQKDKVAEFMGKMEQYYTKQREPGEELQLTEDMSKYLFAALPSRGAVVIDPQQNESWNML